MFQIKTQTEREVPVAELIAALMVQSQSPDGIAKLAVENKTVFIPAKRMRRAEFIHMLQYQFFDAGLLECYRSIHMCTLEKSEQTAKPVIVPYPAASYEILRQSPLTTVLRESKV